MGKFKVGDRVVEDKSLSGSDLRQHWNDYWRKSGQPKFDGPFIVTRITGTEVSYSDRIDGHGPSVNEKWLKLASWQPKVGDRVKRINEPFGLLSVGAEGVISFASGGGIKFEGDDHNYMASNFELISAPALKIEAGKFYKTRDGKKVGPMKVNHGGMYDREYAFTTGHVRGIDGGPAWMADGKFWRNGRYSESDLVALWQEEPVANDNAAPATFKVGTRVYAEWSGTKGEGVVVEYRKLRKTDEMTHRVLFDSGEDFWVCDKDIRAVAPAEPTALVALIEDGQPKPNSRPFIHHTVESATTEAARLAGVYKGSEFGVYVLQSTAKQEKPTYEHEWQRLAAKGEKIPAIKALRAVTGMPLKQSKDVVEHFVDSPYGAIAA